MQLRRVLLLSIVVILGLCPLLGAATITFTLNGTLGPNLNGGPDCLTVNGAGSAATAAVSSTAVPRSTTANTATYALAPGAVTATVGTITFTSTTPWSMKYTLGSKTDALTLSGAGPFGSTVSAFSSLVAGSFPKSVLMHPAPLTKAHEPQNLSSPASYLAYSVGATCPTTKLGFTGTIASNPAAAVGR